MTVLNAIPDASVTHCIFDMDGLLLDTETLEITQRILNKYRPGTKYTWDVKASLLGLQKEEASRKIVEVYELPITWQEYAEEARVEGKDLMKNCRIMPGAERLIKHLHANNVPICLATSSSKESVEVKTSRHRALFELFHHKVMGSSDSDVKEGKPAPDIFLVAAKRFHDNPKPENCLVFEDSLNGLKAAKSAGMKVVMVPNVHVEMNYDETDMVLKSLLEFKPEDFGLPPFENAF